MASVVHFPLQIVVYSQHAIYTCVYTYTCMYMFVLCMYMYMCMCMQLESTRQQLVREADVRMRAEQAVTQASQQLEAMAAQRDTAGKDKVWHRAQLHTFSPSPGCPESQCSLTPSSLLSLPLPHFSFSPSFRSLPPLPSLPPSSLSPRLFFAGVAAAAESQPSAAGRGEEAGSHHGPLHGGPQRHGDSPAPGRG